MKYPYINDKNVYTTKHWLDESFPVNAVDRLRKDFETKFLSS